MRRLFSQKQIENLIQWLNTQGVSTHISNGEYSTVLGLIAKEEIAGVFGSLTSMANAELALELAESMNSERLALIGQEIFGGNKLAGFSFMTFNLLCAPCFAAMGAIRREMNSAKWTAGTIGYMCAFAYAMSLMIYQFGSWFNGTGNVLGTVAAAVVLIGFIYLLIRKNPNNNSIASAKRFAVDK